MIMIELLYNLGLLTALSVISGFIAERWKKHGSKNILQGLLFGAIAVIGMVKPFNLGPGLIFDGRSVMLSLCALFYGPVSAVIALAMTVALRIYQGGSGALMGVLVILSSTLLGLFFYFRYTSRNNDISGWSLFKFGLLVHIAMIALIVTLPPDAARNVFQKIALPVILIYPLATVLIGKIILDNRTRSRYLENLKESELQLRSYINGSPDGVFLTDEKGLCLEINPAAERITGNSRKEMLGKNISALLPDESQETSYRHFQALKKTGTTNGEFLFLYKGSIKRWWSVDAVKISENRFLGFTKDITERKQSEDKIQALLAEKDLLLREVHHRIKNNMTSIKGLLTLQISMEKNEGAAASLKDAESRVQSMITLYNKLYYTDNYRELSVKSYLYPLAEQIIGSFPNKDIVRLNFEINDFILNVQVLSPLGIIVNELLTNMMKYAFTGRDSGLITIKVFRNENRIAVWLQDNGVGISESINFEKSKGFGMQIVSMLTEQLGGSISIERGEGTKFVLEFDS